MLFTDTELQKRFCEGFSFYPFKSLEQHGTLIYKRYTGEDSLQKMLEWNNREYNYSHYTIKITKKLRHKDIPAAGNLLSVLRLTRDWWETRFPEQHPLSGKNLAGIEKYQKQLATYLQHVLQPVATRLTEETLGIGTEALQQMEEKIEEFVQETYALNKLLRECTGKRRDFAPRMLSKEDTEQVTMLVKEMDAFRVLQERNIYLLDAWKTQLALLDRFRAMN